MSSAHTSQSHSSGEAPPTITISEDLLSQVELRDPVPHRTVDGVAISGEQQVALSVHAPAQSGELVLEFAHSARMPSTVIPTT